MKHKGIVEFADQCGYEGGTIVICIQHAATGFEREPLSHPFGFKGGALTEIWQCTCSLTDREGVTGTGIGCQNVLWSDAAVFASATPSAGGAMMYCITDYAARLLEGHSFATPFEAMDYLLPLCLEYGRSVTHAPDMRTTFVLNALVPVDMALWQLYERKLGGVGFNGIIPQSVAPMMNHRYEQLQIIPLISYAVTVEEARKLAEEGYFFLKIKLGSDPEKDGDPEKMLAWDKERIRSIHEAVRDISTPHTEHGHIAYYFDCNGRYDSIERVQELLDYAQSIGALERTVVLEEPFPEEYKCDVSALPVRVAADESAHSPADVEERIALGYRAIALKPIAKTMSVTFRMIEAIQRAGVACFCADLTVGPLQADVNKCFASRLPCLPGLKIPVMESNGWQNYRNWDQMCTYHPANGAPWTRMQGGSVPLSERFYDASAGVFDDLAHYERVARGENL